MRAAKSLLTAAIMSAVAVPHAQGVPPVDQILINDARIFDVSDDGTSYELNDNPMFTAYLRILQGEKGKLTGSVVVEDELTTIYGPVAISGKLAVQETLPLNMKMAGNGGKGLPKVSLTGTYDASVSLMKVVISVTMPNKQVYTWNDAFVPDFAAVTGINLQRANVVKNKKLLIAGEHTMSAPGIMNVPVKTQDRATASNGFQFRVKGINIVGGYNTTFEVFQVNNVVVNTGYGTIITPGSLISCQSYKLFTREN